MLLSIQVTGFVMKKSLMIFIGVLLLPNLLFAGGQTTVIEVEGFGMTHSEAIQNGLIEALKQTRGVTIDSQQVFAKKIRQESVSEDGHNSRKIEVSARNQNSVREATRGLIHEYRIMDSEKKGDGDWEVTLAVKTLRYKTPGISPHSRRKIAIIPFRSTKSSYEFRGGLIPSSELSRLFSQKLVSEMTQTRRFTVLDREYMKAFLRERNLVLSSDAPVSEQMKIGEVLGVDYLLIGTISEAGHKQTPYTIQVTGETGYNHSASFNADYRIVVMATRQIKWSDSVTISLGEDEIKSMAPSLNAQEIQQSLLGKAAGQIVHNAMDNIYPLRVVKVQPNGDVIINQGGITLSQGDLLDVFARGEKVLDPYTGESLGASEAWTATIRITRVIPKMSYARVIKGEVAPFHNGSICRRATPEKRSSLQPSSGKAGDVLVPDNGGVALPFD